jgi:hypothetical protein
MPHSSRPVVTFALKTSPGHVHLTFRRLKGLEELASTASVLEDLKSRRRTLHLTCRSRKSAISLTFAVRRMFAGVRWRPTPETAEISLARQSVRAR